MHVLKIECPLYVLHILGWCLLKQRFFVWLMTMPKKQISARVVGIQKEN